MNVATGVTQADAPPPVPTEDTYDPAFFDALAAAEDRHFWFRSRNEVIAGVVRRVVAGLPPGYRVLEIGCGTGNTLRVLESVCTTGRVAGCDLFAEGLRVARRRVRCPLLQADIHRMPLRPGFQVIGLFDVLEHMPDDRRVLDEIAGLLAPGGRLVMTVPAHMSLWSFFDEAGHHFRRYEVPELTDRLTGAGLFPEQVTEYMAALQPLMWLSRRLTAWRSPPRPDAHADKLKLALAELKVVPGLNGLLHGLLGLEAPLLAKGRRLRNGTSILAVARRP